MVLAAAGGFVAGSFRIGLLLGQDAELPQTLLVLLRSLKIEAHGGDKSHEQQGQGYMPDGTPRLSRGGEPMRLRPTAC